MKGVLILLLTMFAPVSLYAAEPAPVTMHLELAKDTLALAEATMLRAEIHNNSQNNVFLDGSEMFGMFRYPRPFALYLVSPDGENHRFDIKNKTQIASSNTYFLLSEDMSVSMEILLWWTPALPELYQKSLERLPPGNYRLYSTYKLPGLEKKDTGLIYSDTVGFVFLPLKEEDKNAILTMDSLWDFFHNLGQSKGHAYQLFPSIVSSRTPYSEAAAAWLAVYRPFNLIPRKQQYDRLISEKAIFDSLFLNSQFLPYILYWDQVAARSYDKNKEADSIMVELEKLRPYDFHILLKKGRIELLKEEDFR